MNLYLPAKESRRKDASQKTTLPLLAGLSVYALTLLTYFSALAQLPASTQLITNVRVIDGTGAAARQASVRIQHGRITEVGSLTPSPTERVTDGQGLVLTPGFIDAHSHHDGSLTEHPEALAMVSQGITTIVVGQDGGGIPIDTLATRLQRRPAAVNVATYTGHSMLRRQAMGPNLFRTAKPAEIEIMKRTLRQELAKGSLGLSTGLEYESAFFSNRDEVLQLAQVTADLQGRYISHIRSEDVTLDDAVDEIIQIGRITRMPVQLTHIKIALRSRWGQSGELLKRLEQARADGIQITADCYPYEHWNSTLRVLFPKHDYTNLASAEFAVQQLFDPAQSVLVRFAANPAYAGKTLSTVAQLRQQTPAQTLMALIAEAAENARLNPNGGGDEAIMAKSMDEADVREFLAWPHTVICSDGTASGHPRGHGAFTRVLGRYVREQKIMRLETAIRKMTGQTAEQLGLKNRGLIVPGQPADLVLLNPDTVRDNARIGDAKALSSGIEMVWVGGEVVYEHGQSTGARPGIFIRRD